MRTSGLRRAILVGLLLRAAIIPAGAADVSFGIGLVGQLDPFTGNNRYGDIWGEGDYAYIGSFAGTGVGIIDISTPATPSLTATYTPASGGQFKDVKVANGIGYFASDNGGGVHIVDLSTPATPSLLGQITTAIGGYNNVHNLFFDSGYLYLADSSTPTVKVFDVSDPGNPVFVRDIVTTDTTFIHDVTVADGRLFTSGFGGMTDIYDVTNVGTQTPVLLGVVASGNRSHSNWVSGDGNLLASAREITDGDIRLFDISNPGSPVLASIIDDDFLGIDAISPHNPTILGNYLFASWYQAGLQVLDISDPFNPVHIGAFDTFAGGIGAPGSVGGYDGNWGVYPYLGLDRVLLSDLDGGLFVVDATGVVPLPPAFYLFASGLLGLVELARWKSGIRKESKTAV